ncbi:MAG: T9SS type A sorting domain-containing protein [Bacteroidota bacterium]
MKNKTLFVAIVAIAIGSPLLSQTKKKLELNYDNSGNLIERKTLAIQLSEFSRNTIPDSSNRITQFNISPIPTNNVLNIEREKTSKNNISKIELFSLSGQLIQSKSCELTSTSMLDVHDIKSGLYMLVISLSNNQREIHKVIIND